MTQTQATSKGRKSAPPITAHRLFPLAVALWCAALLGLSSFAVPAALLERIVAATGLPALVPAAAPPLGMTARLLVALLLALAGGALGLAIGLVLRPRREAAVRRRMNPVREEAEAAESLFRPRARDSHPDAPVCTPLVLSDDLIDEGLAPVAGLGIEADADVEAPAPFLATEIAPEIAPEIADAEYAEVEPVEDDIVADAGEDADEPAPFQAAPRFAIPEAIVPGAPRSPVAESPLDSLGLVQLIERLALAIAERRAVREALAEAPAPEIAAAPAAEVEAAEVETIEVEAVAVEDVAPIEQAPEPFTPPVAEEPVAPVAIVVQPAPAPAPIPRFASPQAPDASLVSRSPLFRQALAQAVPAVPAEAPQVFLADGDDDLPIVDLGDPALAGPAPEGIIPSPYSPLVPKQPQRVVQLRPGAFHPVDEIDEDEDEADYAVPRFLGRAAHDMDAPEASLPDADVEDEADEAVAEDVVPEERYSSLVGMTTPQPRPEARQEFIRIDEPELEAGHEPEPVVVFPGQAPFARPGQPDAQGAAQPQVFVPQQGAAGDPEEADRALRAALATLQRMTAKG